MLPQVLLYPQHRSSCLITCGTAEAKVQQHVAQDVNFTGFHTCTFYTRNFSFHLKRTKQRVQIQRKKTVSGGASQGSSDWRGPERSPPARPCTKQSQVDQPAPGLVWVSLGCLQGWGLLRLSGHPLQHLSFCLVRKKTFIIPSWNFLCLLLPACHQALLRGGQCHLLHSPWAQPAHPWLADHASTHQLFQLHMLAGTHLLVHLYSLQVLHHGHTGADPAPCWWLVLPFLHLSSRWHHGPSLAAGTRPPCTQAHQIKSSLPRTRTRKAFNKKTGQRVLIRHRTWPDKCPDQLPVYTFYFHFPMLFSPQIPQSLPFRPSVPPT